MTQLFKATDRDVEQVRNKDVLENLWNKQFSTTYELEELSDNTKNYLTELLKKNKDLQGIELNWRLTKRQFH